MARASYGPEAKKRSRHLLQVLLTYANDALECDEAALDALRPEIQTRWQSETRLVVRTKVRFLQALTGLTLSQLTSEQIKEALKRFADFLEILEDNRPSRGGSETWHFTLNLWYKVYAFYHPTFQEYFAAQSITDWHFFISQDMGNDLPPHQNSYRIFAPQWREVILLWLGRDDITQIEKEQFIQALTQFQDGCGGFYNYQAYFLAAQGIAEFASFPQADEIMRQLIKWRFGYFHPEKQKWCRYQSPIVEGARIALLKTDRTIAIATLEQFITDCQNDFDSWNAAYSLGKTFDPGNKIAISSLENLVKIARHETIRWQAAYSVGRVDAGNQTAITALMQIVDTTNNEATCRKAAYSLGKIDFRNVLAISRLEKITTAATDLSVRRQASENLATLLGQEITNKPQSKRTQKNKLPLSLLSEKITALICGISSCEDEDTKRRIAYKLAQFDPRNTLAFTTLLQLVKSTQSIPLRKRTVDNLKEILIDEQLPKVILYLRDRFADTVQEDELESHRDYYKLIWYCAENIITYEAFYQAWHSQIDTIPS
jgi:HEAT repeat protein